MRGAVLLRIALAYARGVEKRSCAAGKVDRVFTHPRREADIGLVEGAAAVPAVDMPGPPDTC